MGSLTRWAHGAAINEKDQKQFGHPDEINAKEISLGRQVKTV
jgi:hypothetical protein